MSALQHPPCDAHNCTHCRCDGMQRYRRIMHAILRYVYAEEEMLGGLLAKQK